jgi:hypothetical protein
LKLAGRGGNLLGGLPLTHEGIAGDVSAVSRFAPGPEQFLGKLERA